MRGLLGHDESGSRTSQRGQSDGTSPASSNDAQSPPVNNGRPEKADSQDLPHERQSEQLEYPDLGVVSAAVAAELYDVYNNDLVDHYPMVSFPEDYSVETLRVERPTLFLAVMAAAARKSQPHLSSELNRQVLHSYAARVFMNSEKSLELVQAMIVTAVWYAPPEDSGPGQHKFYEYIHMAATMALDLGLGSSKSQAKSLGPLYKEVPSAVSESTQNISPPARPENHRRFPPTEVDETTETKNEKIRTFLACYAICSG